MKETPEPERMSSETRDLLGSLTREDVETIRAGLPIIRAVIDFGKVSKWLIITVVGVFLGMVLVGESIQKVVAYFRPPVH